MIIVVYFVDGDFFMVIVGIILSGVMGSKNHRDNYEPTSYSGWDRATPSHPFVDGI